MTRPMHQLSVTGSVGAVFRVTDGSARCVGTGMHALHIELPQGIYTVSASLGRSVENREVLLDAPQAIELRASVESFGDVAFAIAPHVLAAIRPYPFGPRGQLIALRGPWRDEPAVGDGVVLERDGQLVSPVKQGVLAHPSRAGVWRWQLFDLGARESPTAPSALTVTRSVCDTRSSRPMAEAAALAHPMPSGPSGASEGTHTNEGTDTSPDTPSRGAESQADTLPPKNVSHVLPHFGDWTVWAAYPSIACGAPEGVDLPMPYYARLRLTRPGAVPDAELQSLSDQVFTALAARTGLPLTPPVLDRLLAPDADPLLALAAAHLASIALASEGRLPYLPHDAGTVQGTGSTPSPTSSASELQWIDTGALHARFSAWLGGQVHGPLATAPDMVAARFVFGIDTRAHIRVAPVLLRSLDALIAASRSPQAELAGTTCDESVWGPRLQISDSFAFLQWQPDVDYRQELLDHVRRAFEGLKAMQSTAKLIERAQAQVAREKAKAAPQPAGAVPPRPDAPSTESAVARLRATLPRLMGLRRGSPEGARPRFDPDNLPRRRLPIPDHVPGDASAATRATIEVTPPPVDDDTARQRRELEVFIERNVTQLRIPRSALPQFTSVLDSLSVLDHLSLDRRAVTNAMQYLAERLKSR